MLQLFSEAIFLICCSLPIKTGITSFSEFKYSAALIIRNSSPSGKTIVFKMALALFLKAMGKPVRILIVNFPSL